MVQFLKSNIYHKILSARHLECDSTQQAGHVHSIRVSWVSFIRRPEWTLERWLLHSLQSSAHRASHLMLLFWLPCIWYTFLKGRKGIRKMSSAWAWKHVFNMNVGACLQHERRSMSAAWVQEHVCSMSAGARLQHECGSMSAAWTWELVCSLSIKISRSVCKGKAYCCPCST